MNVNKAKITPFTYGISETNQASMGSTILPKLSQGRKNNLYARDMCRVTFILVLFFSEVKIDIKIFICNQIFFSLLNVK